MLLALFLIELAAGLYLFLPLAGRRHAGPKFFRLIFITNAALSFCAIAAHWIAGATTLALYDCAPLALTAVVLLTLRYPKRLVYRIPSLLLAIAYVVDAVLSFDAAVRPTNFAWSIAGALSSVAILGSINLAMLLGHWYLVVRGMSIEPLKHLSIATLVATSVKTLLVVATVIVVHSSTRPLQPGGMMRDIFFWMRAGWGLVGPLALFPLVWGTVRIRSTMAATGILYVDVVAVVIGEVLGGWLSTMAHMPM